MIERENVPDPTVSALKEAMAAVRTLHALKPVDLNNVLFDPSREEIIRMIARIRQLPNYQNLRATKILDKDQQVLHKVIWPGNSWMHADVRQALAAVNPEFVTAANATFGHDERDGGYSRNKMDQIVGWMNTPIAPIDIQTSEEQAPEY